jgi:predicted outer membrane repeat protein
LRQAILDTPSGGTVDFQPSLSGPIILTTGGLSISKDLTMTGPGADIITVSGNRAFRVFLISANFTVELSGITIANGGAPGQPGGGIANAGTLTVSDSIFCDNAASSGGGIDSVGTLTVSDSLFSGNSATDQGGAIYNETLLTSMVTGSLFSDNSARDGGGIFTTDRLTVTASTFSDNVASSDGGGILNFGLGTLTVADSAFSGNSARHPGGGIYNDYGRLTVTDSTLSGNTAGSYGGGGIFNYSGTVTVIGSTFSDNSAQDDSAAYGGGILNFGTATVAASTFSGNSAVSGGGGIYNQSSFGRLTVTDSTFSGNSAAGDGGRGGGIAVDRGLVTIVSSTLSGNSAELFGGGIWAGSGTLMLTNCTFSGNDAGQFGGAIDAQGATITLASCTLSGNQATEVGGGIDIQSGVVMARNTIIAGNSGDPGTGGEDVWGQLDSRGYNLIGNSQGGSGFTDTDLLDVDPLLGPLADNGGPTPTMALLPGSPAIDAGDNTDTPEWDQRGPGFPRIVNGVIDIGAFEFQGMVAPPVTGSVARSLLYPPDHRQIAVGQGVTGHSPDANLHLLGYANDNARPSDAQDIVPETLRLRSERQGNGAGRVYRNVAAATNSGVIGFDVGAVPVPDDQSLRCIAPVTPVN